MPPEGVGAPPRQNPLNQTVRIHPEIRVPNLHHHLPHLHRRWTPDRPPRRDRRVGTEVDCSPPSLTTRRAGIPIGITSQTVGKPNNNRDGEANGSPRGLRTTNGSENRRGEGESVGCTQYIQLTFVPRESEARGYAGKVGRRQIGWCMR